MPGGLLDGLMSPVLERLSGLGGGASGPAVGQGAMGRGAARGAAGALSADKRRAAEDARLQKFLADKREMDRLILARENERRRAAGLPPVVGIEASFIEQPQRRPRVDVEIGAPVIER